MGGDYTNYFAAVMFVCLSPLFLQMADSYNFKLGNITLVVMFYLDSFPVS